MINMMLNIKKSDFSVREKILFFHKIGFLESHNV